MLEKLTVKNYALIDSLELDFGEGLTIITGETGAGKSIMLGALSLLLGGRADTRAIADGSAKSVVEALFSYPDGQLDDFLESNDLDLKDGEILVRREISASGRSRTFVNDVPVTLAFLSRLASSLIDIHSQHENARLNDPSEQLAIIDAVSYNESLREEYAKEFKRFVALRNNIKEIRDRMAKDKENRDFLRFQYDGLKTLAPKRGELSETERRFELLSDADDIRESLQNIAMFLGASERGASDLVRAARGEVEKLDMSRLGINEDEDTPSISERLANVIVELTDISETASDLLSDVEADPTALEKASQRMNDYYAAVKHYRVENADALVDLMEDVKQRLDAIETGGEELPGLEKEAKSCASRLRALGDELTESRRKGAEAFSSEVTEKSRLLGLPNLRFEVGFTTGKLGAHGQDRIDFLAAFNKNQTPGELSRLASGGEMSRLMLTIKGVIAGKMNLPTIIFDEVDTGVSGGIADKMGEMMASMGAEMQVMAITHLPQVAAKGNAHFKVFKRDEGERTVTSVARLDHEARVREIAAMISGSSVSEEALAAARLLLEQGAEKTR